MRVRVFYRILLLAFVFSGCHHSHQWNLVERKDRLDVMLGSRTVTSYRISGDLTKPVLFPVYSPSGIMMTRGFPLLEMPDESRDHPHHIGQFFTFDEVNGHHFWNNTESPPQIRHVEIVGKRTEGNTATLKSRSRWIGSHGIALLDEEREMIFRSKRDAYAIDFTIRLLALDSTVTFSDTKEGLFAVRAADWLTENRGGVYLSAEGRETEKEIWGQRSAWVRLEGKYRDRTAGLAILAHPEGVNYPPYWQARAYGLFSCNPLGQQVYQQAHGQADPHPFGLALKPGKYAEFRYRLLVYEGHRGASEMNQEFEDYAGRKP
jgi:hypothetical protein